MDWDNIVQTLGPRLYRYFRGSFAADVSEDMTQEVLIRLVRSLQAGGYDAAKGSLAMWAFGIAHNVRLESLRTQSRETGFLRLLPKECSHSENFEDHDITVMRQAIAQLPEPERQVVLLCIDEYLSMSEIAKLMEIPVGTVKSHAHRAKQTLKRLMED